jgi:hypothetical protein
MIALFLAAALVAQSPPPEAAWTWTLYADAQPVVLANEILDTASLRTTLECDRGTNIVRLTLYGGAPLTGMARVTAGDASAVAEASTTRTRSARLALRSDHPVFAAFAADGRMAIAVGDRHRPVEVPVAHLAKLRRFTELCAG